MQKHVESDLSMSRETAEGNLARALGHAIKQYRLALGFTPWEFADDIGCSVAHLLKLEDGEVDPELRVLERCASAFKITTSDLLLAAKTGNEPVIRQEKC